MPEVHTQSSNFAGEEPVVAYRAVSQSAIVALGLGLASPLVLVSPLLAVVPLAGALLAAIALRRIRASEGQLVGRTPALVGLVLSLFALGAGVSWSLSRQARLEREATRFAHSWLELMAHGEQQRAHQFKLAAAQRAKGVSLDNFYSNEVEAAKDLQSIVTSQPMVDFLAQGREVKFRCLGVTDKSRTPTSDTIVLQWSFDRPGKPPHIFWITTVRTLAEKGPADWQFYDVYEHDPSK